MQKGQTSVFEKLIIKKQSNYYYQYEENRKYILRNDKDYNLKYGNFFILSKMLLTE